VSQFEDDLREVLRRGQPPVGFAERVLDATVSSRSGAAPGEMGGGGDSGLPAACRRNL